MARRKFDTKDAYHKKIINGRIAWEGWLQSQKEINEQLTKDFLSGMLPYEIVPLEICRTTFLTAPEKELYINILASADNDAGNTFVKSETFAYRLGKSEKQIRCILRQLECKGIIDIASYSDKAKRYIILKPLPIEVYSNIPFTESEYKTKFYNYVQIRIEQLQKEMSNHEHQNQN